MGIRATLLFGLGLWAACPLVAQSEEKGARVTFRVTRFDPGDAPPPEFQVRGGKDSVDMEIPMTFLAGPYTATLRDEKFLDFFEGAAEKPAISVLIPVSMRSDLLLVFVPSQGGYKVLPIHAPASKIKGGDRFVINATETDLAIKLGTAKGLQLAPGQSGLLTAPAVPSKEGTPVAIMQRQGEDWKLAKEEVWSTDKRMRSFLFVYPSRIRKGIAIHGITDRME